MEYAIPPGDSRLSGNPFEEPVQESIQRGFFEPSVDGNGERGHHDGQRRGPTTRTTAPLTRPDQHEDTPEHVREEPPRAAGQRPIRQHAEQAPTTPAAAAGQ